MVADFRQFYSIDLPLCGTDEIDDLERLTVLFLNLPQEARSVRRLNPELQWTTTEYLLWHLEFDVRAFQWSLLDKKSKKGFRPPKPLPTPAEIAHNYQARDNAHKNKEEIDKALGMKGA